MQVKDKLQEDYKIDDLDDNDDDETHGGLRMRGDWQAQLINAAKKGEYQLCQKCINKKADVLFEDKKKWSSLTWAACKGHLKIVKLLLSKGAAEPYLNTPETARKVVTGVINSEVKPTPLQWAAFKGHLQIFWLLLKAGMNWQDVDSFGNNTVNLAAAGGYQQIFKTLLQLGVLLSTKNTRGHNCSDLSTCHQINRLIQAYYNSKYCHKSKILFHEYEIKHYCWTCRNFFSTNCFQVRWVLQNQKSQDKDKLDGRCRECWDIVARHQDELTRTIQSQNYTHLTQKLNFLKKEDIKIEVKLLERALIQQQKLRTQIQILDFLKKMEHVPNYKIILKSVHKIQDMLADAVKRNVKIDQHFIDKSHQEMSRLTAERNLRFLLNNLVSSKAKIQQVTNLQQVTLQAEQKNVAKQYIEQSNSLKTKMRKGIDAQEIFKMFTQFPIRQAYLPQLTFDPKTKKLLDPQTKKKPIDPQSLLPVKKKPVKGKKVQEVQFPDWAVDSKSLNQKIAKFEQLLKQKDQLSLTTQFLKASSELVQKMKKQLLHLKSLQTLTKLVQQQKKK